MIYDCFTFFNELPLLELRLKILSPYVDKFVLVEMNQTFRGDSKPFFFEENCHLFSDFADKIICVHPKDIPIMHEERGWLLEYFQRNSIIKGLKDCKSDDIIMMSDLDEIPNPDILKEMDKWIVKPRWPYHFDAKIRYWRRKVRGLWGDISWLYRKMTVLDALEKYAINLSLDVHHYFLNCRSLSKWSGTVIIRYRNLKKYSDDANAMQTLRSIRTDIPYVDKAGWHFSYMGGKEAVKRKLASIVDGRKEINAIMDKCQVDDAYLERCINEGIDLYGSDGENYEFNFIDMEDIDIPGIEEFIKKYPYLYRN